MPLTAAAIRNAKPKEKDYKLHDTGGLFLLITTKGHKWWRLKYYFEGKEKLISLGTYPLVSLKEAREERDKAKKLLWQGINPSEERKALKQAARAKTEHAFEVIAREWHAKQKAAWSESHAEKVLRRLEKDIFPLLGNIPISEITPPKLLKALRMIEKRGAIDTAHRALQNCGQIFRYAIATGRAERDMAADLRGALQPVKKGHFASITEPEKIGGLLRAIDGYPNLIVRAALQLAPLLMVRPGELRRAEWAEFNLETAEWRIPAGRMKMDAVHIVPLSRQAVEILRELRKISGAERWLFPGERSAKRPISDVTLLSALRIMGFTKEEMTVHGFRSMASTLLNEQGYNCDWIERQLSHEERNSVRAAYNYAQYLPERRKMMQEWADYLDSLK